jgi:hypothetical protein
MSVDVRSSSGGAAGVEIASAVLAPTAAQPVAADQSSAADSLPAVSSTDSSAAAVAVSAAPLQSMDDDVLIGTWPNATGDSAIFSDAAPQDGASILD